MTLDLGKSWMKKYFYRNRAPFMRRDTRDILNSFISSGKGIKKFVNKNSKNKLELFKIAKKFKRRLNSKSPIQRKTVQDDSIFNQ